MWALCLNTSHVVTSLDDIAWTLNIRGNHIEFFPLILLLLQWIRCIYSSMKIN
ncbi:aminopeptidase P family N-terminal domain-containing protein [Clostridium botulinum]|uniref:aminopeptidase P family N-terminal domain-containing protein n=1 Tax=Clostridium botulinum TaxID=1491 RepID=UPI0009B391FF